MATGDVTVFDEAKAYMIDGGWEAADDIKIAILDNTTAPAAGDTTPALGDYTEVGASGSYTAGGTSLGSLSTLVSEASGTMTFDSATNPSWAQNGSNDTDAYWGLIYNDTQAGDPAIAFVELGGPVDMSAGSLTVTWNASGIFTIA
ncbi:MAG: hypothetical protein ACPG4X_16820 [Pikeienuella sp.]